MDRHLYRWVQDQGRGSMLQESAKLRRDKGWECQIAEGTRIGNAKLRDAKLRRGQGPAGGPAVNGNQLSRPPGKGCQRMASTHRRWVWRTHRFQPQWGLTLLAVWALVFIPYPKRLTVANGSWTNRFIHRRHAHVKYKYKHSNAPLLRSPTRTQTSVLASGTDCVCVRGRGAPVQMYWSTISQQTHSWWAKGGGN